MTNQRMRLLPHRLLDRLKQGVSPSWWRRIPEILRELGEWRPSILVLPRSHVHWMKLSVRGIPPRFILPSLRLQLRQFLGDGDFGFAYRLLGDNAELWYWSEVVEGEFARLVHERSRSGDLAPWPESLLRLPLGDGLHLLKCLNGFEAISIVSQEIVRTRWFASLPAAETWKLFVRDAGLDPEQHPLPSPGEIKLQQTSPRAWKLSTSLIQPIPYTVWAGVATLAIAGLLIVMGVGYSLKLSNMIASERVTYEKLAKENAVTIALQKQIRQKVDYLNGFSGARSPIPQLDLMKILLDSGLVTEDSGISLAEWEYRNSRLRLLFAVPSENFSLGDFLTVLEKLPALRDIKLMPDTPPQSVGIQAAISSPASPEVLERNPAGAGVPVPDRH